MADTILKRRGTCLGCGRICKREVEVPERGVSPKYGGPEYETVASLGSLCDVSDLAAVAEAAQWCNRYVVDTISMGVAIAFAMECFEHGILTTKDTDGVELRWGDGEALIAMIHKIARREGIGDVLADGVKRAAERIGKGSERFAMHVKGQEVPMHEPRGKASLALHYAVSPTGADHMEAAHDASYLDLGKPGHMLEPLGLIEPMDMEDLGAGKVRAFYYTQAVFSIYNCVGMCDFIGMPIGDLVFPKLRDFVGAATGWNTSLFELFKLGERANTMARVFNLREGFTAADDTLPERMFEPLENGVRKGQSIDREELRQALLTYYRIAGWDDEGVPTPAKLHELGLGWLVGRVQAAREAAG
jgi:aldehyde:ferredoxin oxidoreductase